MKAIDLISAMCYDSTLAEHGGTMLFDGGPVKWAAEKFRAKIVDDLGLCVGYQYFYLYWSSIANYGLEWFIKKHPAEVTLEDESGKIYLWRISNEY